MCKRIQIPYMHTNIYLWWNLLLSLSLHLEYYLAKTGIKIFLKKESWPHKSKLNRAHDWSSWGIRLRIFNYKWPPLVCQVTNAITITLSLDHRASSLAQNDILARDDADETGRWGVHCELILRILNSFREIHCYK